MRSFRVVCAAAALLLAAGAVSANAAGDLSRQQPIEVTVDLGKPGQHVFEPRQLKFDTGKLYKLVIRNPSNEAHYFTSHNFTQMIFTRLCTRSNSIAACVGCSRTQPCEARRPSREM